MIGTLWAVGLAAAVFVGLHLVPVVPGLRAGLIGAIGRLAYRGLFSLVALGSLAWLIVAHMEAPYVALWEAPAWTALVQLAAMPFACVLAVCAPGNEGIKRVTRHPMLWAVLLWALAHIPANGDGASLILFGAFALFALIDQPLSDARTRREEPARWRELARTTSAIPFAAALAGRSRPRLGEIGLLRIAAGLLLYLVLLFGHGPVIGLSALPG
jgi:uncharacterized membrane protein